MLTCLYIEERIHSSLFFDYTLELDQEEELLLIFEIFHLLQPLPII